MLKQFDPTKEDWTILTRKKITLLTIKYTTNYDVIS